MKLALLGFFACVCSAFAEPYELGEEMSADSFWKADPVLFVKRHAQAGFSFTSDQREGADSRLDDGVSFCGIPVYESRVKFGESGGVSRVELTLFTPGGTEAYKLVESNGTKFRRRVHIDKSISREDFGAILKTARKALTPEGTKVPRAEKVKTSNAATRQFEVTWPQTALPTQATLVWNYSQTGKDTATFKPGFIRLTVVGPSELGRTTSKRRSSGPAAAKTGKSIVENVVRDPRGDVFIDNVPMVDQGQKGYCAVAAAERVLRYYGVDIDEHELAQAAGTRVEGGTSTLAMKKTVESVGKRYRLATVVCLGDFEKGVEERISGLESEVRAYNKAAKKLKKSPITDDMYIRRDGNMIVYSPAKVDAAMDAEVLKEMKVNGMQKSRYTRFLKDVHDQVAKGIPLFWGVTLGTYPEPGLLQAQGGHMRLIVGYNDKKKEILYTDTWGAGHELKRMPADWAWTISHCLMYMKPLSK